MLSELKTKTNQLAATPMKALELQAFQVTIKVLGPWSLGSTSHFTRGTSVSSLRPEGLVDSERVSVCDMKA